MIERSKFYPNPWWTDELKRSKEKRERFYQIYRRHRTERNIIAWKRIRSEHKNLVNKSKTEQWRTFVGCLNYSTPLTKVYDTIRKIRGRQANRIHILNVNNQIKSTVPDIAETIADSFRNTSSDENYSPEFQTFKREVERNTIQFESNNQEYYNIPFSMSEFTQSLMATKETTPGEDQITYKMIKMLKLEAKEYVLKIFNHLFLNSHYPNRWKMSIVVPVPKPGKDHSIPTNYRPIALTSNLGKLFERMINQRLLNYLYINGIINPIQCGGQKGRSTIDHLTRLEHHIKTGFSKKQLVFSIFFDIEKAYDMTWRYGIIQDLHKAGLRGSLPKYLTAFLAERLFSVKIKNHLSTVKLQQNGIPQGSVLSVTLFILKINGITKDIPRSEGWCSSLFVDDLQISFRNSNPTVIREKMQSVLNKIQDWTKYNGFKFSPQKTNIVIFNPTTQMEINPPILKLGDTNLPYQNTVKFLGLLWDSKLT